MAENKTEIEFAGVKFRGGKMLIIITALTTLGGGLYGGFEFYKDYMNMRDKIETYVAPDLSGFQEQVSVMRKEVDTMKELVSDAQATARDSRTADREVREQIRSSETEARTLISNTDKRWDDKLSKVDAQINALEEKLDKKINKALENPLANMAITK